MKKRIVSLVLVFAMALALGIGGTIAWLTAQTKEVINTFTVGNITLDLVETTTSYKIVPGGESAKDPTLKVGVGSEKCYVYVAVTNNVEIEDEAVATPIIDPDKWESIATSDNKTVYRYTDVVDASAAEVSLPVFTKVEYADTITKDNITSLEGKTIVVQGYAHQSEHIDNLDVADDAAKAFFGVTSAS